MEMAVKIKTTPFVAARRATLFCQFFSVFAAIRRY